MLVKALSFLVCPVCLGPLRLETGSTEAEHIMSGHLHCDACAKEYPIERGIPRLLPHRLPRDKQATADGFGYSWNTFAHIDEAYEQQFLDWIHPVERDFFRGKLILDAGCGKGRHTLCAQKFGAREVIAMDLSDAVEAAFANTRHLGNVHVVQGDIYQPPFKKQFDYIYSIGVLHHLPDPKAGFVKLASLLVRDGAISAWIYGAENNRWITAIVDPLRKNVTSRMPRPLLRTLSNALTTGALYPAVKWVYGPVNRRFPAQAQRLFYNDYLHYISKFSRREIESIVLDHLVAPTAFYIPRAEFETWFADAKLHAVVIGWHNRNSWRGFGKG